MKTVGILCILLFASTAFAFDDVKAVPDTNCLQGKWGVCWMFTQHRQDDNEDCSEMLRWRKGDMDRIIHAGCCINEFIDRRGNVFTVKTGAERYRLRLNPLTCTTEFLGDVKEGEKP